AKNWSHSHRGICVLSHTNVAREEIEKRLGDTKEGQSLLGYPHFIGTIHGFANEFLALPWLRSNGYNIGRIDNDVALAIRWSILKRELSPITFLKLCKRRNSDKLLTALNRSF